MPGKLCLNSVIINNIIEIEFKFFIICARLRPISPITFLLKSKIKVKTIPAVCDKRAGYKLRTNKPSPGKTVCLVSPWPIKVCGILLILFIIFHNIIIRISIRKTKLYNIIAIEPAIGKPVVLINIEIHLTLVVIEIVSERQIISSNQKIKKLIQIGPPSCKHPGSFHTI